MILLIDNYDSFSYNLYQLLGELGEDIRVVRNDAIAVEDIEKMQVDHILLSPGPGKPKDAGICEDVVKQYKGRIPILGVCLGHQAICEAYGGKVGHARCRMHGKQSAVEIANETVLFQGLSDTETVGRYHSLIAERDTLPKDLKVTAVSAEGEIMAVEDVENGVFGLQFHPESILTPHGKEMIQNFLAYSR